MTDVTNQYSNQAPGSEVQANAIRRDNLTAYLYCMQRIAPEIVLVGEAPGYKGCRLTGIPFTSEDLLTRSDLFGRLQKAPGRGQAPPDCTERAIFRKTNVASKPQKEATATILWTTLLELDYYPLLWNAFPFHPYKPGNRRSNRPPSPDELRVGEPHLGQLLDLFPISKIVAVGRIAEESLKLIGHKFTYVRHPSHGGKESFRSGLKKAIA